MEQAELEGHYERLKGELARAYSSPVWDSSRIDRLAQEMLAIERIASSRKGGAAPLSRRAGEESYPEQLTATTRPS